MKKIINKVITNLHLSAGMACCAKFNMDKCWYRALVVLQLPDTDIVLVHFVDYGNSEYVRTRK